MLEILNNRYRIIQELAHGGFGQTFLAEDLHLPSKRKCVIKKLSFTSNNPQIYQLVRERFDLEAITLEKLGESSGQIPKLYAHFSENEQFYIVQEWISGDTLKTKLQVDGLFNETQVQNLLIEILPILDFIHSQRVIHRDIKPDNIILRGSDGKPVLIDFGAVKEVLRTVVDPYGHSTTTIIIGTPGFMAVEQTTGSPVFSSDLYSLALTAIYLLTAKLPQELRDLRTGDIQWRHHAKDITPAFAEVLDKASAPNFRDRYLTSQEMLSAIHKINKSHSAPIIEELLYTGYHHGHNFVNGICRNCALSKEYTDRTNDYCQIAYYTGYLYRHNFIKGICQQCGMSKVYAAYTMSSCDKA